MATIPRRTFTTVSAQFTSKERDAETGLDYFGRRYFSSTQARFTSPDGIFADQNTSDPQSWNMYSYVGNNPLTYTDPSGESWLSWLTTIGGAILDAVGIVTMQPELVAIGQAVMGAGVGGTIIGDISGGANSGPWNEQPPIGFGGGVNTGSVFGSGSTGPFVNSFEGAGSVDSTLLAIGIGLAPLPQGTPNRFKGPFLQGFFRAHQLLQNGARCNAFYGGMGADTMNSAEYRFIPFGSPTTGAATVDQTHVQINSTGPFMNPPAQWLGRTWTPADFRGAILLHELGHQMKGTTHFQSDSANRTFNESQSKRVFSACF